jgi:hypothetical protein
LRSRSTIRLGAVPVSKWITATKCPLCQPGRALPCSLVFFAFDLIDQLPQAPCDLVLNASRHGPGHRFSRFGPPASDRVPSPAASLSLQRANGIDFSTPCFVHQVPKSDYSHEGRVTVCRYTLDRLAGGGGWIESGSRRVYHCVQLNWETDRVGGQNV